MPIWSRAALAVLLVGVGLTGGCVLGESGIGPPVDRIFLPGGLAVDDDGRWVYVINSNSDLRFNAGTIVAVDVERARADRANPTWPMCPSAAYLPDLNTPLPACCRDYFDSRVLNCDDRGYVDPRATVRIGSFGANAVIESRTDLPGVKGRLYVSVRSEPSITFADIAPGEGFGKLKCTTAPPGDANPLCEDAYKIRGDVGNPAPSALRLAEEPQALAIDEKLNLLYVGHLIEGLSVVSTCGAVPVLQSVNKRIFSTSGLGVTSVALPEAGNPEGGILVTSRNYTNRAAEVQTLNLRNLPGPCSAGPREKVEAVSADAFFSSAFYADGSDIRAIVETPNHDRAYLLHRNALGRQNPPAVVEVDRSKDAEGRRRNRAVAAVEICTGATELKWHDAGRGPRLYAVCFEAGQIYVLDPSPLAVVAVINIGRGPTTLSFPKNDKTIGYVAAYSDNNLSVIDLTPGSPTENRVIQRIGFPQLRKR